MTEEDLLQALRRRLAIPEKRIQGTTDAVPLYPPVSPATLATAERALRFALPTILRRLYTEVANGGFGPGFGLLGIDGGHRDEGRSLVQMYEYLCSEGWPSGYLPLADFGCGAWAAIDLATPSEHVVAMDEWGVTETPFTLCAWLEAWLADVDLEREMFESLTQTNPFTGEPIPVRGRGKGKVLVSWDH